MLCDQAGRSNGPHHERGVGVVQYKEKPSAKRLSGRPRTAGNRPSATDQRGVACPNLTPDLYKYSLMDRGSGHEARPLMGGA